MIAIRHSRAKSSALSPFLVWIAIVTGLVLACGGDGPSGPGGGGFPPPPPDQTNIEQGWAEFEAGNFTAADIEFTIALALKEDPGEAFNGLGWAEMWLPGYTLSWSIARFDSAIARGTAYHRADPWAGRAAATWRSDLQASASSAITALAIEPRYVFAHDSTYDWRDLHVILAQSFYLQHDYALAHAEVDSLGGTSPDPNSPTYLDDLLAEIDRLTDLHTGR